MKVYKKLGLQKIGSIICTVEKEKEIPKYYTGYMQNSFQDFSNCILWANWGKILNI